MLVRGGSISTGRVRARARARARKPWMKMMQGTMQGHNC